VSLESDFTITSYKHNVDFPRDPFALPKEIQALVELEKAETKEKETGREKLEEKKKFQERKLEEKTRRQEAGGGVKPRDNH
jgi:hypothetical protein